MITRKAPARIAQTSALLLILILSTLTTATTAQASVASADSFNYPDGTSLDGQGDGTADPTAGDYWTSSWGVDGTTPTDTFTVQNGQVVVGDTGGQATSVSRDFDLGATGGIVNNGMGCPDTDPVCATSAGVFQVDRVFIYGQLQYNETTSAFDFGVQFSDAFGVTAGFGLISDGAGDPLGLTGDNGYFYGDLGTSRVISSVTALPNNPYYVYGTVDFDEVNGVEERLQLWVNPTPSDFNAGINPTIDMSFDLDTVAPGRTSIGSVMSLTATTNDPNVLVSWDDVSLATDLELIGMPRLDIGTSAALQESFELWDTGATATSSVLTSYDLQTYAPSFPSQIVQLGIATAGAADLQPFDVTFATPGFADDLRRDGLAGTDGLILSFNNLNTDGHEWKTYHYSPNSGGEVEVYISYDGGSTWTFYDSFIQATGDQAAREFTLIFDTLTTTDVSFMFSPTTATEVAINGIQIVPEPGTALLMGLGLAALAGQGRKRN